MAYDFTKFKKDGKETEEWLKKEFNGLRTGRATPAVLDVVKVESYGAMMEISQLANIATEDARSIRIVPWDMSQAKAIEKAILVSNIGLSVVVDDKGLRVMFPELTSERRVQITKIAKDKLEEAKKTLRGHRDSVMKDLQTKEKDGSLSKDEAFRYKGEAQKVVDEVQKKLEEIYQKKEQEILN